MGIANEFNLQKQRDELEPFDFEVYDVLLRRDEDLASNLTPAAATFAHFVVRCSLFPDVKCRRPSP